MRYPTLATLKVKPKTATTAAAPAPGGVAGALATIPPIDTTGILNTARKQAGVDVNATVAGIRAVQDQDVKQAADRAGYVAGAAKGAAKFLTGLNLGGALASSYKAAGNDIAGLGAGYSGQLQHDVGAADTKLAGTLSRLGAPGGAPSTAGLAGNVVYGLGGKLPAEGLFSAAPVAVANENAATRALVGYGQQQGLGLIGAGQQAAERLQPQITAAEAKLPSLVNTYATTLTNAAEKSRQNAITDTLAAIRLDQAGNRDAATAEYRQAQVDAANARIAETAAHDAATERVATYNANTSRINADTSRTSAATARENAVTSRAKAVGYIVGDDGQQHALPGFKKQPDGTFAKVQTGAAAKHGGITATSYAKLKQNALKAADLFYYGKAPDESKVAALMKSEGITRDQALGLVPGVPGIDYGAAIKQLISGYSLNREDAVAILNQFYAPGERGRPLTKGQKQAIANIPKIVGPNIFGAAQNG